MATLLLTFRLTSSRLLSQSKALLEPGEHGGALAPDLVNRQPLPVLPEPTRFSIRRRTRSTLVVQVPWLVLAVTLPPVVRLTLPVCRKVSLTEARAALRRSKVSPAASTPAAHRLSVVSRRFSPSK